MKRFLLAVMSCALTLCIVGTYSQASALLVNTASFVARLTMIIPTEDDRFVEATPATTNPERSWYEKTNLVLNADGTHEPYTLSTSKTVLLNVDATAFVTETTTPAATEGEQPTTTATYSPVNDEAINSIRSALEQIKANDQTALLKVDYGNVPASTEETAFFGQWETKIASLFSTLSNSLSSTINYVKIGAHPALDLTSYGTSTPYIVDTSDALTAINSTTTNNHTYADGVLLSPETVESLKADTISFESSNKYDYINDHLGYRLVLRDALAKKVTTDENDPTKQVVSEKFTKGNNNIALRFMIQNTGWSSVLKSKKADIVITTSAGTPVFTKTGLEATPAPAAETTPSAEPSSEPAAQSDATPAETATTSGTTPTTSSVPATAVTPPTDTNSVVDVTKIAPNNFQLYDVMLNNVKLPYNDTYKVYLRISSGETLSDGSLYSAISFANPDTYDDALQANLLTTIDVPVEETASGETPVPVHEYETFAVYSVGNPDAATEEGKSTTLKFYKRLHSELVAPANPTSTDTATSVPDSGSPTDGTVTPEAGSPTDGTPTGGGTELSPLGRQFMSLLEAQNGNSETTAPPAPPADNTTTASVEPTTSGGNEQQQTESTVENNAAAAGPDWLPKACDNFDGRTVTAAYAIDLGAAFSDPADIGYPKASDVPWYDVRENITSVVVVDEGISPINMNFWFSGMSKLKTADVAKLDTSKCVSMSEVFNGCKLLTELHLGSWNTRYVYNMSKMFADCTELVTIWVSDKWDTSRVNLFGGYGVFYNCNKLVGQFGFKRGDTSGLDLVNDIKFACIDIAPPAAENGGTTGSAGMGAGTTPAVQRGFLTHKDAPAYTAPVETNPPVETPSSAETPPSGDNTKADANVTGGDNTAVQEHMKTPLAGETQTEDSDTSTEVTPTPAEDE